MGREGSVYPGAPLLGPGRPADRGPRRRAATIRFKEEESQCLSPCSGPAAHPWVCAWACSPGPGRRHHGRGGGPHGQGRLGLARPPGGRRRSGGREQARLMLADISPGCPHHHEKGIQPSPDDSGPARAEDEPNHLYHLPTTSPKPGNVDGIKASTTKTTCTTSLEVNLIFFQLPPETREQSWPFLGCF
jgi:hypothetical protein